MKTAPLWKVSITVPAEAEEALAELLQNTLGQPAAAYTDIETRLTTLSVYLSDKAEFSPAKRAELAAGLKHIQRCGLNSGRGRFTLVKVPREDWAESWKRHFKPLEIGSTLLVRPSWSQRRPRKGQGLVVLDPGLSFGTGQHPTTAFCLEQLAAGRHPEATQSFLDIGTGSGILAIAAARLGYSPVEAFDFDPEAVRVARANARQNGLLRQIRFSQQDVSQVPRRAPRKYSVVCANLISTLLLQEQERILARVAADGLLVLAGILRTEFPQVQQAYEAAGLRLKSSRAQKEWRSGSFSFSHQSF